MVKHTDRAHVHVHLIANLVDNNGNAISDTFIGLRGKRSAQQLTTAYNLKKAENKTLAKTDLKYLRTPEQHQYKIYAAVNREIRKAGSLEDLQTRLAVLGIQMDLKYKGKTQERQGVSFRLGAYCFKGSQIDRQFSYGNITKHFSQKLSAGDRITKPVRDDISQTSRIVTMQSNESAHKQQDQFHSGILEAIFRQEQEWERSVPFELRHPKKPKPKHRPRL